MEFQPRTSPRVADWHGQAIGIQLLPGQGYRTSEPMTAASFGLSYERQRGVHSIASDKYRDFDRLPGTYCCIPAGVDMFSESELGGEYLVIRYDHSLVDDFSPMVDHILRGSNYGIWVIAQAIRSALLIGQDDENQLEELALQVMMAIHESLPSKGRYLSQAEDHHLVSIGLEIIQDNLGSERFRLSDIATTLGLSQVAFLRVFRRVTGLSPSEFVRECRVQRARRLIGGHPARSLSEIAFASGFSHQSHMGAAFRRVLSMTPLQYRQAI
ncbi:AraC family transcriptional regulator [Sphingomonas sp. ERG5]|uniref:AraC family transcriptional regulator n=1 Tax=Sphingomonas sp. ERG5 TaxID=1381597 RepID=UPI000690237A|nr:helix-turn-helix domain-containing protein [Sphingomonas sp. ERG5]